MFYRAYRSNVYTICRICVCTWARNFSQPHYSLENPNSAGPCWPLLISSPSPKQQPPYDAEVLATRVARRHQPEFQLLLFDTFNCIHIRSVVNQEKSDPFLQRTCLMRKRPAWRRVSRC